MKTELNKQTKNNLFFLSSLPSCLPQEENPALYSKHKVNS